MSKAIEVFERNPAEVAKLYGASLGTTPGALLPGRANAKACLKFTRDTGAYNVEIGFDANEAVCYALFEKKDRTPLAEVEVRQLLLQCAARADWTEVTPSAWNPKTKRNTPAAGFRDFQYRETDVKKNVTRILLARHQLRPARLAVWSLVWTADIERELKRAIA